MVRQAHHERAGGPRAVDPCFRRGGQLAQGWLRRGQLPPYSNHSCEGRNPSLGRGGGPAPFPLWVPASAGTTTPQPSFLRKQESILGTRGRPRPIPPSGYPLPRARRRPNRHSCPRAGIHPWGAGERPAPFLPLDARFRWHDDAPTVIPAPEQESIPGARGSAPPHSSLWVPASAGTTTPQPSFLPPSRNPSLGRGGAPRPIPPLGTRFRGTTTPQPSFLRRQESTPQRAAAPSWVRGPPSGYPNFRGANPQPSFLRKRGSTPQARRGPLTGEGAAVVGVAAVGLCRGGSGTAPTCRRA